MIIVKSNEEREETVEIWNTKQLGEDNVKTESQRQQDRMTIKCIIKGTKREIIYTSEGTQRNKNIISAPLLRFEFFSITIYEERGGIFFFIIIHFLFFVKFNLLKEHKYTS